MLVICSGKDDYPCDANCAHAIPHEIHAAGCACDSCYLDSTHPSVGCLKNDLCKKINTFVHCRPVPEKELPVENKSYGNIASK
jgi:hypothetical protein